MPHTQKFSVSEFTDDTESRNVKPKNRNKIIRARPRKRFARDNLPYPRQLYFDLKNQNVNKTNSDKSNEL